eukprot:scaffold11325_cov41-Prasinocladus_malaysianus.AAC.1
MSMTDESYFTHDLCCANTPIDKSFGPPNWRVRRHMFVYYLELYSQMMRFGNGALGCAGIGLRGTATHPYIPSSNPAVDDINENREELKGPSRDL